jgi:hypothetical protein
MGKRRFHKGFQAVGGTNSLGFRVIERPQIAQRLEELRSQNQGQETGKQRYAVP